MHGGLEAECWRLLRGWRRCIEERRRERGGVGDSRRCRLLGRQGVGGIDGVKGSRRRGNGRSSWGVRLRFGGVGRSGVKLLDLGEEIIVALAFGAGDALFDKFDDGGSLLDNSDVTGADDEAAARGEETDDGVVTLVTDDVPEFPTRAG